MRKKSTSRAAKRMPPIEYSPKLMREEGHHRLGGISTCELAGTES
jgi:hypothetical protein